MGSKRSRSRGTIPPPKGDNFKLIEGVSAEFQSRLHQAGILTYAQFASTSPEDIVRFVGERSGLTVERITEMDWLGQARELALQPEPAESREVTAPPEDNRHYATFEAELSLDNDNYVLLTRVTETQTRAEEVWDGWDEDRFIKFVVRQSGMRLAQTLQELEAQRIEAISAEPSSKPASSEQPGTERSAGEVTETTTRPHAHKLEIVTAGSDLPSMLLQSNQPFGLRLSLDLADVAGWIEEPLPYTAVVHVRRLNHKRVQSSMRTSGKITLSESTVIKLSGISLAPGSYLLGADVTIHQPGQGASLTPVFHIQTEAALIQVY
ncbi:MAG: hypothetical protein L0226_17585 [Acidobacteria bacterium]|nr:hypothetical protein [Acidobacteriota bacterium]